VRFLETGDYLEKGGLENQPITCAVCHDPHGSEFQGNLRADISDLSLDNFCVRCHSMRVAPPSLHGPHGAQGPLVLQRQVGWIPAGYEAPPVGSHGNDSNPRLCATCHVMSYTVTDDQGGFVFEAVGHTFEAIPCLDEQGIPAPGPCEFAARDFLACAECHGSEVEARQDYEIALTTINDLLDQIWVDTDGDDVLDADDDGLLPIVIALGDTVALDPRDDVITVPEGVLWNAQLAFTADRMHFGYVILWPGVAGDGGEGIIYSSHKSSGNGVHNPVFLTTLLQASIDALIAWLP
jgi:predicted CXXCH cytochrome family protein